MKLVVAFSIFSLAATIDGFVMADSSCDWANCPELVDGGDCSISMWQAACGNGAGTCERAYPGCGLAEKDDTGKYIMYCTKPPPCGDDGGCSVAADPARAARRVSLPGAMLAVGAFLLAVDRRRRRR